MDIIDVFSVYLRNENTGKNRRGHFVFVVEKRMNRVLTASHVN